jgi:hypothetical protein
MYFDRFDICDAHYLFLSEWHEGQWSKKYRRLCNMGRFYKPSPGLRYEGLSNNAKEIYDTLVLKEIKS